MGNSIKTGDTIHISVNNSGLDYQINKGNKDRRSMTPAEVHEFVDLIVIDKYYANPLSSTACNNTLI